MTIVIINENEIHGSAGANLLWTALDNGIYIPNLCAIKDIGHQAASCRLCFVDIEGEKGPVPSCTRVIYDGMIVHLDTPSVNRLRATTFELLMSHHQLGCRTCSKNGSCELQRIASYIKVSLKPRKFRQLPRDLPVDSSHSSITYNTNKCVLCGKCVHICHEHGSGTLDFCFRGINTLVSTFNGIPLAETECSDCLLCVDACPTGALENKTESCELLCPLGKS